MRQQPAIHGIAGIAAPLALSLLVAGCFGGPLVTPEAPPATPAAASPSTEPATPPASHLPASPSHEPSTSEPPTEEPVSPSEPSPASADDLPFGDLDAGTYDNPRFDPLVTLTVDDGWYATVLNGFFDIQQRRGTPEVIAVQFANVEGVVGQGGREVTPDDAAQAARVVARNDGLEVLGRSGARVGGLTGQVVEVRNTSSRHVSILHVPPGRLGIDSGRALWIAFLDTPDDGVLAVMVGGPSEGWDEALAIAEPVLESVVIAP